MIEWSMEPAAVSLQIRLAMRQILAGKTAPDCFWCVVDLESAHVAQYCKVIRDPDAGWVFEVF